MSAPSAHQLGDGMYSKFIDDEGPCDEFSRRPELSRSGSPSLVRATHALRAPGLYRVATFGLAALCGILLICVIAVSAHYKNKQHSQSGAGSELNPESQKQTQDSDVHTLLETIKTLKEENLQLQAKLNVSHAPPVVQPSSAPIVCPDDWLLFRSSCYLISGHNRPWDDSQTFCEAQGGHLAIIHAAEEQTFIWNQLPRGFWNAYWFGITDAHTEDQWKWVDGTPLVGGFWEVGEPNNHINEDCGYIVKTTVLERVPHRSWYDAPCTMSLPFVCEKEMGPSAALPH